MKCMLSMATYTQFDLENKFVASVIDVRIDESIETKKKRAKATLLDRSGHEIEIEGRAKFEMTFLHFFDSYMNDALKTIKCQILTISLFFSASQTDFTGTCVCYYC